ncbi:hypothetical protein [Shimia sediminis]|uniref:hypothetical protein n=1 Tax=Shimia sediminis TaxID=2497945 RepID=UPI000F8E0605|nr:hypothetical protein [Shimia sediminis]
MARFTHFLATCGVLASSAFAHADTMPAFIAGKTFEGLSSSFGGLYEFPMEFHFADRVDPQTPSKVINRQAGCEANLFATETSENQVVFKERATAGNCLDLGYTIVTNDPLVGQPVAYYSPLSKTYPRAARTLLHEANGTQPTHEEMRALASSLLPLAPPVLWGSWVAIDQDLTYGFIPGLAGCDRAMPVQDNLWLPPAAKGEVTFWPATSETGGSFYVALSTEDGGQDMMWRDLRHLWGEAFYTTEGLRNNEKRVIFAPQNRQPDKSDLMTMVIEDQDGHTREITFAKCLNPFDPPAAK